MPDDTQNEKVENLDGDQKYEAPSIEEVVTREGFEREVAYAGISLPSGVN